MGRFDRDHSFEERPQPPRPLLPDPSRANHSAWVGRSGAEEDYGGRKRSPREHQRPERVPASRLDDREIATLRDVGSFRVLTFGDLVRYHYQGKADQALHAMNHMVRRGLIEYRTSYPGRSTYVTLTAQGRRAVQRLRAEADPDQESYCGLVKGRDTRHDAALYRLYRHEAAQIAARDGRVTRVVLGFDLQRSINRRLSTIGRLTQAEQLERKQEVAQEHGLKLVNGKILVPDLRLEYEGPDHEAGRVDLELVTANYHQNTLALKAQAGFALYALPEDRARLRPAVGDPEIMQDILSL
jgi:DNA-binding MarR family transcriptional regulator